MRHTKNTLIYSLIIIFSFYTSQVSANVWSANFLAKKWYIVDNTTNPSLYRLQDTITRKEFMKVVAKLSWWKVEDTCLYSFRDVSNDWGCKYIELALKKWFIAKNKDFRPDDNISKLEAIKLVFKWRSIEKKYQSSSWQDDYIKTALTLWLISSAQFDYNASASRGWIFELAAKTFSDFQGTWLVGTTVEKTLVDGKLEGSYIEYYASGKTKLITSYVSGKIHWEYIWYYISWNKNFEAQYKNGKLEWIFTRYYENGNISQEESYVKWTLTGMTYFYDMQWNKTSEREYIGWKLLYEKKFD